ncbi:MAG TPA: MarR family transcriptional regulator [Dehalococcoidia bacterium]|nr:MarR family transcriptional regulator [Dehalococcoidia bacterium]
MKQGPKHEELIENILQLGEKAFRELFPMVPTEWLQLDLTMPQLKVVLLLFMSGPARMSDIASALGVSLATATGVVDRLVERDVVQRESQPEDRRVVLCRLSEKGQKMIGRLWQLSRDNLRELLDAIEPAKLGLVIEALQAISQASDITKGVLQK